MVEIEVPSLRHSVRLRSGETYRYRHYLYISMGY